jgi:ABC-type dipeptide/oligopeptide/nickel transport system permease subunit
MSCQIRHFAKWVSIAGAAFFAESAFASSPMIRIGEGILIVVAILGVIVGGLGAAFDVKVPRLLLTSLVVPTILFFVVLVGTGGMGAMLLLAAVQLVVPFMICLTSVYGFVRLARHLLERSRQ